MPDRTERQRATVATMIDIAQRMAAQTKLIAQRDVVEVGDVMLTAQEQAAIAEALLHIDQAASDLHRLMADEPASIRDIQTHGAFEPFRDAFLAGDVDRLADAFMPDGAYGTNAGVLLEGYERIRAGAAEWFRRRPPGAVVELEMTLLHADEVGDLRWELLEYRQHGYVPGQPAAGSLDEAGHGLAVYRRDQEGAWRIRSLVVNRRLE
jgi:ketosteroid isomerase-like protein